MPRHRPRNITLSPCHLVIIFLLNSLSYAQTTLPAPPEPEQYLSDGRYSNYAQAAQEFLRNAPDSSAAPRVAMDLLLTATVYDDQPAAQKMKQLIVASYPASVQAKYLIGSMPDAAQFAQLMAQVASENFLANPIGFPARFDQSQRLGVARFGSAALGTGPELVQGFLLAQIAGDAQLANADIQLLNQAGPSGRIWRQILAAVADDATPLLVRIQRLHALPNRAAAAPFEQYLLSKMTDAQRASPEVVRIEIDDLIDASRLDESLPLLEKLSNPEPRIVFWRAMATAANGNPAAADAILKQLISQSPQDPWAKEAAALEPAVAALDANVVRNVEAALSASRRLRAGAGSLEGHALYTRADGLAISIYLGIDSPGLMQLAFSQGTDPAIIYRVVDNEASLFVQGAGQIFKFTKPVVYPAPHLAISRFGRAFTFTGDLKFAYSFDELQTALSDLLSSNFSSTREGLEEVLHDFARRGIIPLAPQPAADGATVYTWVNPAVADPTFSSISFTVAPDGAITAFETASFKITDLHYGPAGIVKVLPPPLPTLPITQKGPMSVSVLQAVLPAVYQLLTPPPPAPPSTQTSPTP